MSQKIILASSSFYRKQLLSKMNIQFDCISPDVDEASIPGESPQTLALRLSQSKARAVYQQQSDALIIASDQVASTKTGILLGKPGTKSNAVKQLEIQSGQSIYFYTGLCVIEPESGKEELVMDTTIATFRNLSIAEIDRYVAHESPLDCAGSFKSEGYGITLLSKLETEDPNALIGLPLIKLAAILRQLGVECP